MFVGQKSYGSSIQLVELLDQHGTGDWKIHELWLIDSKGEYRKFHLIEDSYINEAYAVDQPEGADPVVIPVEPSDDDGKPF